ncbi:hypothetical protein LZ31DRAFT_555793 [Colletotrichum somersetense]|nr:hypothetical protein LZ31DRAFT_555793 [Colletotrichum somersetense]
MWSRVPALHKKKGNGTSGPAEKPGHMRARQNASDGSAPQASVRPSTPGRSGTGGGQTASIAPTQPRMSRSPRPLRASANGRKATSSWCFGFFLALSPFLASPGRARHSGGCARGAFYRPLRHEGEKMSERGGGVNRCQVEVRVSPSPIFAVSLYGVYGFPREAFFSWDTSRGPSHCARARMQIGDRPWRLATDLPRESGGRGGRASVRS